MTGDVTPIIINILIFAYLELQQSNYINNIINN